MGKNDKNKALVLCTLLISNNYKMCIGNYVFNRNIITIIDKIGTIDLRSFVDCS